MKVNRRWPLLVVGASAGTAIWSGWVGLGGLTGFGVIHPLPGIADGVRLNTAITLPIGFEAYAAYALSVATSPRPLTDRARRYAWQSAAGALALGMLGQIAYHLMAAAHVTKAPWQVVAAVSCLPVAVLGAAALLWHLGSIEVPAAPAPLQVQGGGESDGPAVTAATPVTPALAEMAVTEPSAGAATTPVTPPPPLSVTPRPSRPVAVPDMSVKDRPMADQLAWLDRQMTGGKTLSWCAARAGWSDSTAARRNRDLKASKTPVTDDESERDEVLA